MNVKNRLIRTVLPRNASIISESDPFKLANSIISWRASDRSSYYTRYLRSSSIYSCCIREHAIGYFDGLTVQEGFKPAALQAVFAIGHAVHSWLQNSPEFLGAKLLGWWECSACGRSVFGRHQRRSCSCGAFSTAFRYREHAIKIGEPLWGTGHIDLLLELEPGHVFVCDIKTIDGDAYKKLDRPMIAHVYQLIDYLLLLDYDTSLPIKVVDDRAILLYIPKSFQAASFPSKAFWVERSEVIEDALRKKRTRFADAIRTGSLPKPLDECVSSNFASFRARSCPFSERCKLDTNGGEK